MKTDAISNQLRWVMLLLAAAVILPTVCLLWFMNRTIKNERLAMKEKLVQFYSNQNRNAIEEKLADDTMNREIAIMYADGFIVYDSDGKMTFPVIEDPSTPSADDLFSAAYAMEYEDSDPNRALAEYRRIAGTVEQAPLRIQAEIAEARCLRKLNRPDDAIQKLETVLSSENDDNPAVRAQKCYGYLLLLDLYAQTRSENVKNILTKVFDYAMQGMEDNHDFAVLGRRPQTARYLPSSLQALMLDRFMNNASNVEADPELTKKIKMARWMIERINTSLSISNDYPQPTFVKGNTVNSRLFRLDTKEPFYANYRRIDGYITLMVFTQSHVAGWLAPYINDMTVLPSRCRVYDAKGNFVAGEPISNQNPLITIPIESGYLAGWTTELFVDDAAFDDAASRQNTAYVWTGTLVIGLVFLTGAVAIGAVNQQIRLNRLKNDFIATVTHELKTPLASMRLLVDTLREGRYEDKNTAPEYLNLIAQENKRLTHLIDSFLTFSRMERNKQVFDLQRVDPAEITTAAVDAMQAKLTGRDCRFEYSVDENLPAVHADKDAMVTVLVNLLDNACKYTNGNKHIQLTVCKQEGSVCFNVKDNGIGISPRAQKKIFNRFYQVDSRLSRRSEGCGLGLSIVSFIVEAHKGKITVESQPGQGSVFTVTLPAL